MKKTTSCFMAICLFGLAINAAQAYPRWCAYTPDLSQPSDKTTYYTAAHEALLAAADRCQDQGGKTVSKLGGSGALCEISNDKLAANLRALADECDGLKKSGTNEKRKRRCRQGGKMLTIKHPENKTVENIDKNFYDGYVGVFRNDCIAIN